MFDDCVKQRCKVQSAVTRRALLNLGIAFSNQNAERILRILNGNPLTRDSVQNREVELVVVCLKIHEKFVNLINNLVDSGILLVQLVYKQNRVDSLFQRLFQNKSRLRHRALTGIHEKDNGVHRFHDTLNLGTEVRVPRSVHDINLYIVMHN